MPDAQVGCGLPIGGVLAMENSVIPYPYRPLRRLRENPCD
jgi:hypothetical protein